MTATEDILLDKLKSGRLDRATTHECFDFSKGVLVEVLEHAQEFVEENGDDPVWMTKLDDLRELVEDNDRVRDNALAIIEGYESLVSVVRQHLEDVRRIYTKEMRVGAPLERQKPRGTLQYCKSACIDHLAQKGLARRRRRGM